MNKREKKLLGGLIGVIALAAAPYAYSTLIAPLFEQGAEIADGATKLAELEEERDLLEGSLRDKYRNYVLRSDGTSVSDWRDALYESLNGLLGSVKLGGRITPKPENTNPKSKITTLKISVSATGTFAQCVDFVRGFYTIPYVARLTSLKLVPTPSGQKADHDQVQLDAEVEALLVPQSDDWGQPAGKQPETMERIASADTSMLRNWRPFNPYFEPAPPAVVQTPVDPDPTPSSLTPVEPEGEPFWNDADELMIKMVSGYGSGEYWVREVLLENSMNASKRYVATGEILDGGELVLVHALGAVVHKYTEEQDFGYWVYPLGELLNTRIKLEESAAQWPEIYVAARQYLSEQGEAAPPAGKPAAAVEAELPAEAKLSDAEKDQLFQDAAAQMAFADELVGPPLPPAEGEAVAPVDVDTSAIEAIGTEPEETAGAPASKPRRTKRSPVQGSGADRRATAARTRSTPEAAPRDASADDAASETRRESGTPNRAKAAAPTRGARRAAPKPTPEPQQETDNVAPPE